MASVYIRSRRTRVVNFERIYIYICSLRLGLIDHSSKVVYVNKHKGNLRV